jgi:hypothetical protein
MGYLAVTTMHSALRKETPEKRIDTGQRLQKLADLSTAELDAAKALLRAK